ncbi:MAG TPA: triose-phosphate isomerase [Desulfobacteraceae bacterium]|mgnify:CR=1 FL=1|nr:triose-phosphate isomerase [Desulfobacteraceae bacterium]
MHTPIIAANWKMHKTVSEAVDFISGLKKEEATFSDRRVIVAPPFTALRPAADALSGSSIGLAAQNLSYAESGAFTGEVSAGMITDAGCTYVIIGHSERRHLFGETNEQINKKLVLAFKEGLKPIFCIGETLQEREADETISLIRQQITEGLINISAGDIDSLIIAYEPVWAIGTGRTATPEQAEEVHRVIKETVQEILDKGGTPTVPVIYGGSVNEQTIESLMNQDNIDGVLVGGASLKLESFLNIIRFRASDLPEGE